MFRPIAAVAPILARHRRAYITLNFIYYGALLLGMLFGALFPDIQHQLLQNIATAMHSSPVTAGTFNSYLAGRLLAAFLLTWIVNLLAGVLFSITLPSLLIPFTGILVAVSRALLWGLIHAPTSRAMAHTLVPHSLTLLLEGQGSVLASLAAFIQGSYFLLPRQNGLSTHTAGYRAGLLATGRLYLPITIVLGISAMWESFEVICLPHLF